MGSSWSGQSEPPASASAAPATASAAPSTPIIPNSVAPKSPAAQKDPVFKNCWSCRVLSGSALFAAGTYVYLVSRRPMKLGYSPGPGTIAKMVFGISIACWGVIVLTDPKGKAQRVV
ncbi:distal membrane-arm assembly complex protein 1 [Nannospalax galili]|uniref:Distal membrane arm assembly complex 1 n=1 Tax=Nannospalax galili TaxID=1026970 RepID=A0A8C6RVP7_NANGA|nr:distal membrane-arm assembly complex protein 1 [Nannospalax galili]